MPLSMYRASIPVFLHMLDILAAILDKVQQHAHDHKIEPQVLLNARLAPDMYGKGRFTPEDRGVLEAAFDGKHGWFWRNRTNKPVTVTLRTEGEYIAIKRVI